MFLQNWYFPDPLILKCKEVLNEVIVRLFRVRRSGNEIDAVMQCNTLVFRNFKQFIEK